MTKSTAAVIMTSPSTLAPWGDDGWRFASAMQLVADGPDWLYAEWPTSAPTDPQAHGFSLTLRDAPRERAEDIAAMAFTLLHVEGYEALSPWWTGDNEARKRARDSLERICTRESGQFKMAIVETTPDGVAAATLEELGHLGFGVIRFAPIS